MVRRLWDSWEDDAEIRDAATGRFIDRDKLHYIDFIGKHFSVKGPSIVPRPPQGQPLVTALAHSAVPYRFAARSADVVYVTPDRRAGRRRRSSRQIRARAGRGRPGRRDRARLRATWSCSWTTTPRSRRRPARPGWTSADGAEYTSDAHDLHRHAAELADLLADWQRAGHHRLPAAARRAARRPRRDHRRRWCRNCSAAALFRRDYEAGTLRGLLGLPRPANRYAEPDAVRRSAPA